MLNKRLKEGLSEARRALFFVGFFSCALQVFSQNTVVVITLSVVVMVGLIKALQISLRVAYVWTSYVSPRSRQAKLEMRRMRSFFCVMKFRT